MSIIEFNQLAESYMRVIARTALIGLVSWAPYWYGFGVLVTGLTQPPTQLILQKSLTYISMVFTLLVFSGWILEPKEYDEINKH